MRCRAQGQAVVALVDAHETDSQRPEFGRSRQAEGAARVEAEHLGVEVEARSTVHDGEYDVAETL